MFSNLSQRVKTIGLAAKGYNPYNPIIDSETGENVYQFGINTTMQHTIIATATLPELVAVKIVLESEYPMDIYSVIIIDTYIKELTRSDSLLRKVG